MAHVTTTASTAIIEQLPQLPHNTNSLEMEVKRVPFSFLPRKPTGNFVLPQIVETSSEAKRNSKTITAQSPIGPVEEFAKFAKLPTEIRWKIWEAAIVPRIVGVREISVPWVDKEQGMHPMTTMFHGRGDSETRLEFALHETQERFPSILHVCKESRMIGEKFYQHIFQNTSCALFFNFALDTLYIPHEPKSFYRMTAERFFLQQKGKGIENIRSFAYDDACGITLYSNISGVASDKFPIELLLGLPNLQELKIVILDSSKYEAGTRNLSQVGRAAAWLAKKTASVPLPPSTGLLTSSYGNENRFWDLDCMSSNNLLKTHTQALWQLKNAEVLPNDQHPRKRLEITILMRMV